MPSTARLGPPLDRERVAQPGHPPGLGDELGHVVRPCPIVERAERDERHRERIAGPRMHGGRVGIGELAQQIRPPSTITGCTTEYRAPSGHECQRGASSCSSVGGPATVDTARRRRSATSRTPRRSRRPTVVKSVAESSGHHGTVDRRAAGRAPARHGRGRRSGVTSTAWPSSWASTRASVAGVSSSRT